MPWTYRRKHWVYLHFYHIPRMIRHRWWKLLFTEDQGHGACIVCHDYWWLGDAKSQDINKHCISLVCPENFGLTLLPVVPHICLSESGEHWFRYSTPNHYRNQCWVIVNWKMCQSENIVYEKVSRGRRIKHRNGQSADRCLLQIGSAHRRIYVRRLANYITYILFHPRIHCQQ